MRHPLLLAVCIAVLAAGVLALDSASRGFRDRRVVHARSCCWR